MLGANSGSLWLPSEGVANPVLNLVLSDPDIFENFEEQRVLYVAHTCVRKSVAIKERGGGNQRTTPAIPRKLVRFILAFEKRFSGRRQLSRCLSEAITDINSPITGHNTNN